jgi:hypothetical protein
VAGVIPEPWEFALLALAAFRLWKLVGDDAILDWPRDRLLHWVGDKAPERFVRLEYFITCPWCAGAWASLLAYVGWMATLGEWPDSAGDFAVAAGVWFAISAVVGYLGVGIDALED